MTREQIEEEVKLHIDQRREQLFGDIAATRDELQGQVQRLQNEIRGLEMRKMMLAAEVPAMQTPFQGLPALGLMDTQPRINYAQRAARQAATHSQAGERRGAVDLTATETVRESVVRGSGIARPRPMENVDRGQPAQIAREETSGPAPVRTRAYVEEFDPEMHWHTPTMFPPVEN